ncbi:hypothetical protein FD755_021198 [Muntiacus reevesi]|uniref:Uncharacterized protein n=1 Tax=Muntiacus reevesi TaxID=9886 RepID=A0A5N3X2I9_MUNRE|nr:hypothetical protein FD755_021198 [Muntiacus reevesi]
MSVPATGTQGKVVVQRRFAVVFPAATEGRWARGRGKCREKQEGEGCREEHALGFGSALNPPFPSTAGGECVGVGREGVASGEGGDSILCTPVLNSYSAQPNFGGPASPAGSNPARPGGFPGANSPGPVADLYGPASQDSGVGNYISAASPQPGSGFGHGIAPWGLSGAQCNGAHRWWHKPLSSHPSTPGDLAFSVPLGEWTGQGGESGLGRMSS